MLRAFIILFLLTGCTGVQYKPKCWEIAVYSALGARYELGLDKKQIRVMSGYKEWSEARHAWAEIYVDGRWVRVAGSDWVTEGSPWQYSWIPDKLYTYDEALERSKHLSPRTKNGE